jgi:tight adherence protein B
MAEILDAVRRDVVAGVRFARQSHARMAGPRASAVILALLPAVGVVLGEAMGAGPLHVLFSTSAGQVLLVVGCGLIWAGMAWSAKLTAPAVPR